MLLHHVLDPQLQLGAALLHRRQLPLQLPIRLLQLLHLCLRGRQRLRQLLLLPLRSLLQGIPLLRLLVGVCLEPAEVHVLLLLRPF